MTLAITPGNRPARILGMGMPGSGKTGSLAALANAGFKIRILGYDKASNLSLLYNYVEPQFYDNISILSFEDKLQNTPAGMAPVGTPSAYNDGIKALMDWKVPQPDGTAVSLGASKDWGMDTVVVLDSISSMGDASFNRAYALSPRTKNGYVNVRKVYGVAQTELMNFLKVLLKSGARHHVLAFAHMKMLGPKDVEKDDEDLTKQIKEEVAELIPTRWYPVTPGRAIAPEVGREFSATILYETKDKGGKVRRVINSAPRLEIDLKLPALNFPADLPAETGLIDVFKAITPGIEACLADHGTPGEVLASANQKEIAK